ncbi:MAG: cation-translocating P-type ATPase [Rubrivivax sp.]
MTAGRVLASAGRDGTEPERHVLDDPIEFDHCSRWLQGPRGERLAESVLQLGGLHCAACSSMIESALLRLPGVRAAQVGSAASLATVRWDPSATRLSLLIDAVVRAGYSAVPDAAAPARALRQHLQRKALWQLFVAAFCAMQIMMLATPSYVAAPGDLQPDVRQLLNLASWLLSLPVLVFSAAPFFRAAWVALQQRRVNMDVPVALGVAITFIASTGAAFDPGGVFGQEVYFDSMAMFLSFLLGARYLELRARHAAAQSLEAELARLPETAERMEADGSTLSVSLKRLQPGDRIRVPVGAAFGADGVIEAGSTRVDESMLTGEARAVLRSTGDEVIAGSLNLEAAVRVRVVRVGADTRLRHIVSMMQSAMTQRPAVARMADRWAAPFLWAVLLLAAGAAAVWSLIDPGKALWVAVSVLIVTCPCALSLAAPATLVAAARGLAQRGVLLQRLDALEALARVQQVCFDKTGTLTDGQPQWCATQLSPAGRARFRPAAEGGNPDAESAALHRAAALASASSHPLSRALVMAAGVATRSTPGPAAACDAVETAGLGLSAVDAEGHTWQLGSGRWVAGPDADAADADAHVALGCDGALLATFAFEEAVRPDAAATVRALRDSGVRVTLLTGDRASRASALATRLQIDEVCAAASPADKLAVLARAQAGGRCVAMVGDGINDAPVLARADVSLAMGQGALIARSQADAVITSNRLSDLLGARATAIKAMTIVRQNFVWAGLYNLCSIPLALAGLLPPWAAGLGMAGSSLVVIGNALRAAR